MPELACTSCTDFWTGHGGVELVDGVGGLLDESFLDGVILGHLGLNVFLTLEQGGDVALKLDDFAGHGHDGLGPMRLPAMALASMAPESRACCGHAYLKPPKDGQGQGFLGKRARESPIFKCSGRLIGEQGDTEGKFEKGNWKLEKRGFGKRGWEARRGGLRSFAGRKAGSG